MFNNAAQVWNHTFFWNGMKPGGGGAPTGAIAEKIDGRSAASEKFVEDFKAAAVGRFGSGWAWLVSDNGELKIVSTPNAEMPAAPGVTPLLVVDVWEHAYYLDYQNLRPVYVQTFFDKLVNWDFVNENLAKAKYSAQRRDCRRIRPGTETAGGVGDPEGRRMREAHPPALVGYGAVAGAARPRAARRACFAARVLYARRR